MPFESFAPRIREPSPLRDAITAAYRRPERECVRSLIADATLPESTAQQVDALARRLVTSLRAKESGTGIDALVQEYALSSEEGVALMCLAEALLRIPDDETRDALISDKIARGDWRSHLGADRPLFVNAATWGLLLTGRLVHPVNDRSLGGALTRLIARAGEPVIRRSVNLAMRLLGEQFVLGETIEEALHRAREQEDHGFTYSYDMLGEAAATAGDARAYFDAYAGAIHAIGSGASGEGVYARPGISIKLSALHPRYCRSQADRMMRELLPRVQSLATLAKGYGIGLNIDAEEADRLELSLDIFERLAFDPDLAGWDGLGFVVQAYGKRCPFVIDWLIDLARRSGHRIMVRLVKGAYWDAEIKRAQVEGLPDFPVYTRKVHTDVAYLACARKLLGAKELLFPQFATHNAQSVAALYHMAGADFTQGDYEFQCLHGMGQPLYEEVVGKARLNRPCRIYAPVGTHDTLLAYLVRRLLENGANSSFVHRIADPGVPVEALTADPARQVAGMPDPGAPHPAIALPGDLFPARRNSAGLDMSDERVLEDLDERFRKDADIEWTAMPTAMEGTARIVRDPGSRGDIVGRVFEVAPEDAPKAVSRAAGSDWAERPAPERAACLERAADMLESTMPGLLNLIMREGGKTLPNAVGEVREAVDFLRYYAQQARTHFRDTQALGPVVCISPWNFPLAIFTGQVAAALGAGNAVLAKPAEETPLIAAQAVRILHAAAVPEDALQLVPGDGAVGAALVGAEQTAGVIFTGSTEVARAIQRQLSGRILPSGRPVPLIAETGGQNAMIVDSSALAEQVIADVLVSAFDSAGQRCSALRILCLQDDIAEPTLAMLKDAMAELRVGPTDRIGTDVGPVIHEEARQALEAHISQMAERGHAVHRIALPEDAGNGTFVPPTIIEIDSIAQLGREVFGPVLHVVRYRREELGALIEAINATGYGLTFGLHSRLDTTAEQVLADVHAGNRYVNRNIIGAVVGVQPFGGHGLSGTGPKAGGPLYMTRLVVDGPSPLAGNVAAFDPALVEFVRWLEEQGENTLATIASEYGRASPLGLEIDFPGPVGERNFYSLASRGPILIQPSSRAGFYQQIAVVLATGNRGLVAGRSLPEGLPASVASRFAEKGDGEQLAGALFEGDAKALQALQASLAEREGPVVTLQAASPEECATRPAYRADWMCEEIATSINTSAAGGNASLMALAD